MGVMARKKHWDYQQMDERCKRKKKTEDTPMLDCCSQNRLPRTTSLRVLGWEPRGTVFRKSFERPPGSDKAGF